MSQFSGISVREKGSIKLIENHLGIKSKFVLDHTFLIDTKYYLELIQNYKDNHINNEKYIFVYNVAGDRYVIESMKNASQKLHFGTYYFPLNNESSVYDFIFHIVNSKAVITNSYHGTVFSIIFNKPFLTIYNKKNAMERYTSLGNLFNISERLFENSHKPDYNLLTIPLNINYKLLNQLKRESINFLKEHLK